MDGTRKKHPEGGNQVPERQAWYVLTHKWTVCIKQKLTSIQSSEPEKLYNKDDSKRDTYTSLRRGYC